MYLEYAMFYTVNIDRILLHQYDKTNHIYRNHLNKTKIKNIIF